MLSYTQTFQHPGSIRFGSALVSLQHLAGMQDMQDIPSTVLFSFVSELQLFNKG